MWHTLRHTFASRLLGTGAGIVTMRYAHTNDEAKTRAVQAVGSSAKVVTVHTKTTRNQVGTVLSNG